MRAVKNEAGAGVSLMPEEFKRCPFEIIEQVNVAPGQLGQESGLRKQTAHTEWKDGSPSKGGAKELTTGGTHHGAPNYYDQSTCPETILRLRKSRIFRSKAGNFCSKSVVWHEPNGLSALCLGSKAKAKWFLNRGMTAVIRETP